MARRLARPIATVCAGLLGGAAFAQDAQRGETLYSARCGACHALDEHGAGPRHRGILGRRAGSEAGYAYSAALRASNIAWTAATLDRWLSDPSALVPGNKMVVRLADDPRDRADLIAYLSSAAFRP